MYCAEYTLSIPFSSSYVVQLDGANTAIFIAYKSRVSTKPLLEKAAAERRITIRSKPFMLYLCLVKISVPIAMSTLTCSFVSVLNNGELELTVVSGHVYPSEKFRLCVTLCA